MASFHKLSSVIFEVTFILCTIQSKIVADQWWLNAHFYQIFPLTFQDSNGDGLGDLNGITARLPYLKSLDVTGVWIEPIYKSPLQDTGYDPADFYQIDPVFGTFDDFHKLVKKCHKLGMKVILDFVPNHTSDQSRWFQASKNPSDPEFEKYKDYYNWSKGKLLENGTRVPPSNWISQSNGSIWEWIPSRQEYVLHQFSLFQIDLNYRNPCVVEEMKNVLRFWLKKGVDGFRVDAISYLFEAPPNPGGTYPDEPLTHAPACEPTGYCYVDHIYTYDQPECFVRHWHHICNINVSYKFFI